MLWLFVLSILQEAQFINRIYLYYLWNRDRFNRNL